MHNGSKKEAMITINLNFDAIDDTDLTATCPADENSE